MMDYGIDILDKTKKYTIEYQIGYVTPRMLVFPSCVSSPGEIVELTVKMTRLTLLGLKERNDPIDNSIFENLPGILENITAPAMVDCGWTSKQGSSQETFLFKNFGDLAQLSRIGRTMNLTTVPIPLNFMVCMSYFCIFPTEAQVLYEELYLNLKGEMLECPGNPESPFYWHMPTFGINPNSEPAPLELSRQKVQAQLAAPTIAMRQDAEFVILMLILCHSKANDVEANYNTVRSNRVKAWKGICGTSDDPKFLPSMGFCNIFKATVDRHPIILKCIFNFMIQVKSKSIVLKHLLELSAGKSMTMVRMCDKFLSSNDWRRAHFHPKVMPEALMFMKEIEMLRKVLQDNFSYYKLISPESKVFSQKRFPHLMYCAYQYMKLGDPNNNFKFNPSLDVNVAVMNRLVERKLTLGDAVPQNLASFTECIIKYGLTPDIVKAGYAREARAAEQLGEPLNF